MTRTIYAALAVAGAIAVAACSPAGSDDQPAGDNVSAAEAPADGVSANDSDNAGPADATDGNAPSKDVSSGMPVPGTNTPEHVVVNQDGSNAGDNRL